jgi:D-alanyl-D-alanine carboxypeptidase/D-alanyl-D-alanine-endopeptidase (penicillin-binding protein 4)
MHRHALVVPVALVAVVLTCVSPARATPMPADVATVTTPTAATLAQDARISRLVPSRFSGPAALASARARTAVVIDPVTRRVLFSRGSATPMRGASTTKLATAVTALRVLGTTTRFPTTVVDGRGPREIVLVGGGDPLLSSAQLRGLAHDTALALAARVPAPPSPTPTPTPTPTTPTPSPSPAPAPPPAPTPWRISVRVDDSLYPVPTPASGWPSGYLPGVVSPVRPLVRDLRHSMDTSKDAAVYFAARVTAELGTLLKARTDLAPKAVYTGRLVAAPGAAPIARFEGNTSGAALAWMLRVSDNDVAEMFFRNSAIARGRGGSWAAAHTTEIIELERLGIDVRGWRLYDGSGVSRNDRVTARGLVQLLATAVAVRHPELAPLKGWLPVAGVSGTLSARAHRFTTRPTKCARGLVFAKTGTLHDAIGLAGYAQGRDGITRIFAVLVAPNGRYSQLAVRQAVDLLPTTAVGCW